MKVLVIKPFVDKKEGVTRQSGDTFISTRERFDEINSTDFGVLVREVKEENVEEVIEVKEEAIVKEKKKKASKSG